MEPAILDSGFPGGGPLLLSRAYGLSLSLLDKPFIVNIAFTLQSTARRIALLATGINVAVH
jgi:hypothetical protein